MLGRRLPNLDPPFSSIAHLDKSITYSYLLETKVSSFCKDVAIKDAPASCNMIALFKKISNYVTLIFNEILTEQECFETVISS